LRLVVTGGGTGGHIYPALEVARLAQERGGEILYLGSLRGQEGEICRERGIVFHGFGSEPLYSLRTPKGWKAVASLLRATVGAKAALRASKPEAVFSTGGYSAAPIMAAARSLTIPYTIHEANSVPGRANRMFAGKAAAFTCTFHATVRHLPQALRTGQPIRRELRQAVSDRRDAKKSVLVLGGSQGSSFLNEAVPRAAETMDPDVLFTHAAGRGNFDAVVSNVRVGKNYKIVPYLETSEIVQAYLSSSVAVARSGSTVAEFAMFGLPSVLVPLPNSADDHQRENAREFVELGGATLIDQTEASDERLAEALRAWLNDDRRRETARTALQAWDIPNATEQIVDILLKAAEKR
jgi:UDP-N-acetylglucosamine--N-acetylmuramyl-(pentapeptide) pyrophosphoryl-undecaprenol N-acetylglucosamine transferase